LKIYSPETDLLIGDAEKLPFGIERKIDIEKLQQNVEERSKYGVASQSGIRQIFDPDYGDAPTRYFDEEDLTKYRNKEGADITDAAKIHVATIADTFVELLKDITGKTDLTVLVAIDSRHTGPAMADIIIRIFTYHSVRLNIHSLHQLQKWLYIPKKNAMASSIFPPAITRGVTMD